MFKNLQNLNFFAVFAPQKLKEYGSTILQFSLICCMEWAVCAEKAEKNAVLSLKKSLFGTKISWKNGNYRRKMLGKMEILRIFALEKWNFLVV